MFSTNVMTTDVEQDDKDTNDSTTNDTVDIFDEEQIVEALDSLCFVFKSLSKVSLPIAVSYTLSVQFFIFSLQLVRLAKNNEELAATGLFFKMLGFIFIGLSPIFGAGISLSNQLGELQRQEHDNPDDNHQETYDRISAMGKGIGLASIPSLLSMVALTNAEKILITIFRQDPALAKIAGDELFPYAFAMPGMTSRASLEQCFYGFTHNMAAMGMGLGSLGLTTLLGTGLSYGWFGNTPMGRLGVIIGGIIEPYLTTAAYAAYLRFHKDFAKFDFLSSRNNKYVLTQVKAVYKIGLPTAFTITTDTIASMVFSALTGVVGGQEALIATSILNQFGTLTGMLKSAFAEGVSLQLGQYAGSHMYKKAANYAHKGLLVSGMWIVPIPFICSVAPDILLLISGQKVNSMAYFRGLAPIMGCIQISDAMRVNFLDQLHAVNDNNVPALITLSGMGLGILTGSMLGLYSQGGMFALAGSYATGLTLSAVSMGIRWRISTKPENIQLQQERQEALFIKGNTFTLFRCCSKNKERQKVEVMDDEKQLIQRGSK